MRCFIFLALIIAISGSKALAASWTRITSSVGGDVYYLDKDSLRSEGTYKRGWVRIEFAKLKYNDAVRKYYWSELRSYAAQCDRKLLALVSYSERDGKQGTGESIASRTYSRENWQWSEPTPDSVGSAVISALCDTTTGASAPPMLKRLADDLVKSVWLNLGAYPVSGGTNNIQFDSLSVRTVEGSKKSALVKITPPAGMNHLGKPYDLVVQEIYVDCATARWALSAYILFTSNIDVVAQEDTPERDMEWKAIASDTPVHDLYGRVCQDSSAQSSPRLGPTRTQSDKQAGGFGTGWLAENGYVVTAFHVVEGASKISLIDSRRRTVSAKVLTTDPANDIAILDVAFATTPPGIPLDRGTSSLGARVFTIGFPHPDVLGLSPKLTAGEISATSGLRDDPRLVQISVPVQSGNSGGPLINMNGGIVGLVSSKLSATQMLTRTGDLTQNVNYALKARYVLALLQDVKAKPISVVRAKPNASLEDLVAQVRDSIFIVVAE